jgi:hypothetical protein
VTDYWSRPGASGQPDFEIPLDGGPWSVPSPTPPRGDGDGPSGRNWGAIAGLGALAAIALVIAGSIVMQIAGDDGGSADPASTTMELELPAPVPTSAPPQTADVGALGGFDTPETRYPPMVSAPTPGNQQVPGFPMVPGSDTEDLSAYDLDAAVANNMPGADPQRSMFNLVSSNLTGSATTGGTPLPPLRATASSEPVRARDALTIEYAGETRNLVVDRLGNVVYALTPEDNGIWNTIEPAAMLTGSGADSLDSLFDAFVTGPMTTSVLAHATITPSPGLMRIMGGGFARRFDVDVPIEFLRPYGALLFANVSDGTVDGDAVPDSITFQVYVTDEAHLALVTANFTVGPQYFVLSQFFDQRPANVRIEFPMSASVQTTPPTTPPTAAPGAAP